MMKNADSGIAEFLKAVGAVVPEDFDTGVDDALLLLATDLSHSELVAVPATQNLEYSHCKADLYARNSISDKGEALSIPGAMPIHRNEAK